MATLPVWHAPTKMKNLLKNPANGGIQASENMASIIVNDR